MEVQDVMYNIDLKNLKEKNISNNLLPSIAWCVCGRLPWRKLPAYLVAQVRPES